MPPAYMPCKFVLTACISQTNKLNQRTGPQSLGCRVDLAEAAARRLLGLLPLQAIVDSRPAGLSAVHGKRHGKDRARNNLSQAAPAAGTPRRRPRAQPWQSQSKTESHSRIRGDGVKLRGSSGQVWQQQVPPRLRALPHETLKNWRNRLLQSTLGIDSGFL